MGVDVGYGEQKKWLYGLPFDGMNKNNPPKANFGGIVPPNDFIFPQDKQIASRVNAGASVTGTMTITFHPTAMAVGTSTATVIRKIGGADANYSRTREWYYGLTIATLLKNDAGAQKFWYYGWTPFEIFPTGQVGLAIAGASVVGTMRITFQPTAIAVGTSTVTVVRKIGGATDPQGGQKFWSAGQASGLTFFALSNSVNTTNKNLFANQSLWSFGIATPDMVGTVSTPVVTTSPARWIGPNIPTKRQMTGWPTTIKVVSANMPLKGRASG